MPFSDISLCLSGPMIGKTKYLVMLFCSPLHAIDNFCRDLFFDVFPEVKKIFKYSVNGLGCRDRASSLITKVSAQFVATVWQLR